MSNDRLTPPIRTNQMEQLDKDITGVAHSSRSSERLGALLVMTPVASGDITATDGVSQLLSGRKTSGPAQQREMIHPGLCSSEEALVVSKSPAPTGVFL